MVLNDKIIKQLTGLNPKKVKAIDKKLELERKKKQRKEVIRNSKFRDNKAISKYKKERLEAKEIKLEEPDDEWYEKATIEELREQVRRLYLKHVEFARELNEIYRNSMTDLWAAIRYSFYGLHQGTKLDITLSQEEKRNEVEFIIDHKKGLKVIFKAIPEKKGYFQLDFKDGKGNEISEELNPHQIAHHIHHQPDNYRPKVLSGKNVNTLYDKAADSIDRINKGICFHVGSKDLLIEDGNETEQPYLRGEIEGFQRLPGNLRAIISKDHGKQENDNSQAYLKGTEKTIPKPVYKEIKFPVQRTESSIPVSLKRYFVTEIKIRL